MVKIAIISLVALSIDVNAQNKTSKKEYFDEKQFVLYRGDGVIDIDLMNRCSKFPCEIALEYNSGPLAKSDIEKAYQKTKIKIKIEGRNSNNTATVAKVLNYEVPSIYQNKFVHLESDTIINYPVEGQIISSHHIEKVIQIANLWDCENCISSTASHTHFPISLSAILKPGKNFDCNTKKMSFDAHNKFMSNSKEVLAYDFTGKCIHPELVNDPIEIGILALRINLKHSIEIEQKIILQNNLKKYQNKEYISDIKETLQSLAEKLLIASGAETDSFYFVSPEDADILYEIEKNQEAYHYVINLNEYVENLESLLLSKENLNPQDILDAVSSIKNYSNYNVPKLLKKIKDQKIITALKLIQLDIDSL